MTIAAPPMDWMHGHGSLLVEQFGKGKLSTSVPAVGRFDAASRELFHATTTVFAAGDLQGSMCVLLNSKIQSRGTVRPRHHVELGFDGASRENHIEVPELRAVDLSSVGRAISSVHGS